ncbi:MAG: hypothetical protein IT208_00510 [Chthonomonadales bacterium]|nr:hypothetical protein [Chthonomonadales bacterium]
MRKELSPAVAGAIIAVVLVLIGLAAYRALNPPPQLAQQKGASARGSARGPGAR